MEVVKASEVMLKLEEVMETVLFKGQDVVIFIPEHDRDGRSLSEDFLINQQEQVLKMVYHMLDNNFQRVVHTVHGIDEDDFGNFYYKTFEGERVSACQYVIFLHKLDQAQESEVLASLGYEAAGWIPTPIHLF